MLERADQLQAASDYLADAATGRGRLVYVSGEAGIGKTTFVRGVLGAAEGRARVGLGGCDGSSTPAPLGALVDLLPVLPPDVWPAGASRHDVFTRLVDTLRAPASTPWLLAVEDVHWADEATLDLVRHLARRIHECRALVLVTYRPDEVASFPQLRALLGDTASATGTRRIDLPPLTPSAVATLAAGSPASGSVDAARLHAVTGGNAFFVTEVLAGGADPEHVPPSVRDAILGRVSRLDEATQHALEVVALAGSQAEVQLVDDVLRDGMTALDEPMARGLLVLGDQGVAFRHELGRRAVADEVPAGRRLHVHRRLLAALTAGGADPARLAHHAEAAGDSAAVIRHAPVAAARAASLGAHREAVQQYRRTLRAADRLGQESMTPEARADLLWALGYELYLTDHIGDSIEAVDAARAIWESQGADVRVGDAWRCLSRLNWFGGHNELAEEQARLAIARLEPAGPGQELALAYSNRAQLRMLSTDLAGTREWGARTLSLVEQLPAGLGRDEVRSHALNNLGAIEISAGDLDAGTGMLTESLDLARQRDLHEHAARAYCNLGSPAVVQHRHAEADRWLQEGMDYCADRDLDSWYLYLEGFLTRLHLNRGEHEAATSHGRAVLSRAGDADVGLIEPLVALSLVEARTSGATVLPHLERAERMAAGMAEAQRVAPVASARSEAAWLAGDLASAQAVAARAWPLVRDADCRWNRGIVARWLAPEDPARAEALGGPLAPPFAAELGGAWAEAAELWNALGCPFERGLALALGGTREGLTEAVAAFTSIGAHAAADRARTALRDAGWPVPRGTRAATRAHPAGLTAREAEVLALLLEGLTDAAIADRLVISRRTAEHHVSSILAKTGASGRQDLAQMGAASAPNG